MTCVPTGPCDGPDFLFGCAFNRDQVGPQISETALAVDLCLSGPDDCGSSHNSIRPHLMVLELGEESPVLSVEIAGTEQAGAPLSTPQTVEASELVGDAVLDTSP